MSTDSYLTQGGIRVHRTVEAIPVADADRARHRRARRPPRRAARVELRVPRAATRAGTSASSTRRWRSSARGRTAPVEALNARGEVLLPAVARRCSAPATRSSASSADGDAARHGARRRPAASPRRSAAASPRVFSRAARARRAVPASPTSRTSACTARSATTSPSSSSRPPAPAAPGRPARPRALPARRAGRRRPPPRGARSGGATTSRSDGALDRGPAARRAATRPYARRAARRRARCDHEPGEYAARRASARARRSSAATCSRSCPARPSSSRARRRPSEVFRAPARAQPGALRLPDQPRRGASTWSAPRPRCTCAWTATASRPARSPAPSRAAATRSATPSRSCALLNSDKDESELTMCTDVDRNDKSRVCEPGQRARDRPPPDRDVLAADPHRRPRRGPPAPGLRRARRVPHPHLGRHRHRRAQGVGDAVHRGPRAVAARLVRRRRRPARLRRQPQHRPHPAHHPHQGRRRRGARRRHAALRLRPRRRGGRETRLKASAFLDAHPAPARRRAPRAGAERRAPGAGRRVLLVDHQDSFVHTLANYFRQTGRRGRHAARGLPRRACSTSSRPTSSCSRPGPGRPRDFDVSATHRGGARARRCPIFGVCLGLQGMVEHFGGELGVLDYPMHGKPSRIPVRGGRLFDGLPGEFTAGRYHSLFALREKLPAALEVTAESDDGVVMAVEHARCRSPRCSSTPSRS